MSELPTRAISVVNAIAKLKNLKAIHNEELRLSLEFQVVNAIAKLKNLKAIHNRILVMKMQ